MGRKSKKPPIKELCDVIENCYGNLSVVAKKFGVRRSTVKSWVENDKKGKISDAINEGREILLDFAEAKLAQFLQSGDKELLKLVLKTIGKDRGYVEQVKYNPNQLGGLDLNKTSSGEINLTVQNVIIDSREKLDNIYNTNDTPKLENKSLQRAMLEIDIQDGEFNNVSQ